MFTLNQSKPLTSLSLMSFWLSSYAQQKQSLKSVLIINPQKSDLIALKSYSMKNKALCFLHCFPENSFSTHHGSYILIYEKNNQLFFLLEKMNKMFFSSNFNKPLSKIDLEDYMSEDLANTCKKVLLNFKLGKNLEEKPSQNKSIKI